MQNLYNRNWFNSQIFDEYGLSFVYSVNDIITYFAYFSAGGSLGIAAASS